MNGYPTYTLKNNGVSISTAITVLQWKAGTNGPIEVLRASLTQGTTTTSSQVAAKVVKKSAAATVTAAVAGTTLFKNNGLFPTSDASLGTAATGITASAEGTDTDTFGELGFNVLNGYVWLPTPDEQINSPQGGIIGLKFSAAPPSATWYGELVVREIRGA